MILFRIPLRCITAPIIILIFSAIFLAGCNKAPLHQPVYDRAAALLDTLPEQAMELLDSIRPAMLQPGLDSARYILLRALAEDKCYYTTSSDSSLQNALTSIESIDNSIACLQHHNAKPELRNALYIKGRRLYLEGDLPHAVISLLDAESYIDNNTPDFHKGLIFLSLSEVYGENLNIQLAEDYADKAIESFHDAGKNTHAAYSVMHKANCRYNLGEYTDAIHTYGRVIVLADSLSDCQLYYGAIDGIARSYIGLHDYRKSREYFRILRENNAYPDEKSKMLAIMAEARGGDIRWADSCGRELVETNSPYTLDCIDLYTAPREIISKAYNDNYEWNRKFIHSVNSNEFVELILERQQIHQRLHDSEIKNKRLQITVAILICIFILIVCVFIVCYFSRRIKNQTKSYSNLLDELNKITQLAQHKSNQMTDKINSMSEKNRDIISRFTSDINQRIRDICELSEESKLGSRTRKSANALINDLRKGGDIFKDFEKCIDLSNDYILSRFQNTFASISKDDYKLFVLINAGFSNDAMSTILNISQTALSSRKHRLKLRIASIGEEACAFLTKF